MKPIHDTDNSRRRFVTIGHRPSLDGALRWMSTLKIRYLLNYLASTVFEKILSQDGTIATDNYRFHGNKDAAPKSRHEKLLHIRWMVFHENSTSLDYVVSYI